MILTNHSIYLLNLGKELKTLPFLVFMFCGSLMFAGPINFHFTDANIDRAVDYIVCLNPIELNEVEVFTIVSPNGDGNHDILTITGLDVRPINSLRIYNRSGRLVFTTVTYNTTGNYFDGTSQEVLTTGKDKQLPIGTYFYILNYVDTTMEVKNLSGHLYLN